MAILSYILTIMKANIIRSMQERLVLSTFRRAAKQVPFYKKYLENAKIDYRRVRNISDFKSVVPILDKNKLFTPQSRVDVADYCLGGDLKKCRMILPSSGFSGKFSFGLVSKAEQKRQEKVLNFMLKRFFNVGREHTLLVNTLSMGISVPATNVISVNTGLRSDVALSIMKAFSKEFDQIILMGENAFIKSLIERGSEEGFAWRDHKIQIIFGGESFPESFRAYLENIVLPPGSGRKTQYVGSSFGFAEVGLNVLWETPQTILLRKQAYSNPEIKRALMDRDMEVCPMFFQCHPMNVYIEEIDERLVFTNLNPHAWLPIIRYATGDKGKILDYPKLLDVITRFNITECLPQYKMPIIAVRNRDTHLNIRGKEVYADMVKKAIYESPDVPRFLTGYFRMSVVHNKLKLEVQIKKGASMPAAVEEALRANLSRILGVEYELVLYKYNEFPYAMELDYERKFKYYV
ncbi:MAG: hypothetical protein ABH875_06415 [Candidatus Omnitrophota bacterium]